MITRKKIPLAARFWARVLKTDTCWLWTGAKTAGGYGVLQSGGRNGKIIRAHRLSWELVNGPIPDGVDICHHCDIPPCVRPDHLFQGTARDNAVDKQTKGRARGGSPRGERHHQAKLTDDQVINIRAAYATGNTSLNKLAMQYDVSKRTILNIVHRTIWIHI